MKHSPGFLALVNDARGRVKECNVEQARARLASGEAVYFVDVREDHEYAAGHAAGAKHLSKGIIERDIEVAVPHKGAEVILYCGGGFRSVLVADNLQKMGYTNVTSMDGGWRAWNEAGAPVAP